MNLYCDCSDLFIIKIKNFLYKNITAFNSKKIQKKKNFCKLYFQKAKKRITVCSHSLKKHFKKCKEIFKNFSHLKKL